METEIRTQIDVPSRDCGIGVERENQRNIAPDWTESEWFAVWLKLARREYEPAKN
ncbi:MAG TPA: hypothetical protein VK615_05350 [Candidatus Binatia bacterium]|nr:hypothetical protein [Candidatus Binatia bacterium]